MQDDPGAAGEQAYAARLFLSFSRSQLWEVRVFRRFQQRRNCPENIANQKLAAGDMVGTVAFVSDAGIARAVMPPDLQGLIAAE
ncbi:MAG TPA: hypothetical protein DDY14_04915 [Chromatiaceae bacterium]|jgi:hypothetical protein|nr:MAG: hypothetical protein N838_12610 [Thiohalocapsa sp. PB-PSB1]HBG94665.1 hypothetical protein [Chromatiaceae bacterium]HCS92073.1 hypothetical protein [Chromatiaceae bacterium]